MNDNIGELFHWEVFLPEFLSISLFFKLQAVLLDCVNAFLRDILLLLWNSQ